MQHPMRTFYPDDPGSPPEEPSPEGVSQALQKSGPDQLYVVHAIYHCREHALQSSCPVQKNETGVLLFGGVGCLQPNFTLLVLHPVLWTKRHRCGPQYHHIG